MVNLTFWLGLILTFGCALFAIVRGDGALRAGGLLLLVLNVLMPAASFAAVCLRVDAHATTIFSDFFTTLVISFGFLYLGYRHGSIWLAPAMTIQGAELYILSQELSDNVAPHSLMVWDNIVSCGVSIALVLGVFASARERKTQSQLPVFRTQGLTPDVVGAGELKPIADNQEAVFVFHLPQDDSARLMNLAAEAKVLPSQYVRELISTFLDGDHYAPREIEDSYASH
jgi:hypothetical protein